MKDSNSLFRSRSDVYRALQLFFITSSTLIAIRFAFPGLLYVPWLYPLIVLWAFVLMVVSLYFSQTSEEEEEEPIMQTKEEPEQTQTWERLKLRALATKERPWQDDELV